MASTTLQRLILAISLSTPWAHMAVANADVLSQTPQSLCCKSFRQLLPESGQVELPGSPGFVEESSQYFSAQESELVPSCRLNPTSPEQVSLILNTATRLGCEFAVRSGGHMPWAGSANIEGLGVTIDLSSMNSTTLSKDRTIAYVESGAKWGSVYNTLESTGLVAVGARGQGIGVGGFLLGGGISFFSPKYGFGSDSVVGYQVVTANGEIIEANSLQNPDLFWALRLGSTNFGVVTRFDLRTIPSTQMWGGIRSFNLSYAFDAAKAMIDFTDRVAAEGLDTVGLDLGAGNTFFMNFAHITPDINGSQADVFNSTLSIPFLSDTTRSNVTLLNLLQEIDALFSSGFHVSFRTLSIVPDAQFIVDMWEEGRKIFASYDGNPNASWTLGYSPFALSMLKATEVADDAQGLTTADGAIMNILLSAFWTDDVSEDDMQTKLASLIEWGKTTAQERGIWNKYIYLNYASPDVDPYTSLKPNNTQRLMGIRDRYDPEGLLRKLWVGGFKL